MKGEWKSENFFNNSENYIVCLLVYLEFSSILVCYMKIYGLYASHSALMCVCTLYWLRRVRYIPYFIREDNIIIISM